MLNRAIWRDNTEVPLEIAALANGLLQHVFESRTIVWMNPVHKRGIGACRGNRIQTENAKMLGRP